MNEHRIPNIFRSSDIVYHYCDINTAVEFILHEKQLRLSNRKKSNDPIENMSPFISFSDYGIPDTQSRSDVEAKRIEKEARLKIRNAKQLCLCMNHKEKENPNTNPTHPFEYFGFLKPRMWPKYANNYKGVCLAFSLEGLKRESSQYLNGPVEYIEYSQLYRNHLSIDLPTIEEIGTSKYILLIDEHIKRTVFRKNVDYQGENEYRFLSLSKNEYDYINIETCLMGIIVSDSIIYTNDFMNKMINDYAEKQRVPILYITWDPCYISFRTKTDIDKSIKKIEEDVASLSKQRN